MELIFHLFHVFFLLIWSTKTMIYDQRLNTRAQELLHRNTHTVNTIPHVLTPTRDYV